MPLAFCAPCAREMKPHLIGVTVFVRDGNGGNHKKYAADLHRCPQCGATVAVGLSNAMYDDGVQEPKPTDLIVL